MNKKKNIIIIIELIIILILGSLIIIKCINPPKQEDTSNNNNQSNGNTISQEGAEKIVNEKNYIYDAEYEFTPTYDNFLYAEDNSSITISNDVFKTILTENGYQYFKNLKIPYINIKGAETINKNLEKLYYEYANGFNECAGYKHNNEDKWCSQVLTYYTYKYNNILSVIIVHSKAYTAPHNIQYLIYNFNLNTGKLLTNEELISTLKYNNDIDSEIKNNISNYINNYIASDNRNSTSITYNGESYNIIDFNNELYSQKNTNEKLIYVDNDGKLNYILYLELNTDPSQIITFKIDKKEENNNMNNTNEQTNTTIDDTTKQKIINNIETYNTYYYQQFQCTNTDLNDTITTEDMMEYRRCLDYNNITEITNYYKSFTSTNYFDESIKERFIEKDNKLYTYVKGVAPYTYEKNSFEITNIETANNIIEITGTYKTADDGLYEEITHQIKAKFIYENNNLVLDNIESIDN